jgi:hypothetical protein
MKSANAYVWKTPEDVYREMQYKHSPGRQSTSTATESLLSSLEKCRQNALDKSESSRKMKELLDDEVEYLKRKTGASRILWSMNWDLPYLRRCLMNVHQMLAQADDEVYESIIHAINRHQLIFGRGTFVCCDGSIQFGADEVPEAWQKVCVESNVRRFDIRNVELLTERIRELVGMANVIVDPFAHLLRTIQQLQSIIVRVSSRSKKEAAEVYRLSNNCTIQIVSGYGELVLTRDGRIQIPCNVDIRWLIEFLKENAIKSQTLYEEYRRKMVNGLHSAHFSV